MCISTNDCSAKYSNQCLHALSSIKPMRNVSALLIQKIDQKQPIDPVMSFDIIKAKYISRSISYVSFRALQMWWVYITIDFGWLEFVRIWICQNSFLLKIGICQNWNLSELEIVRIDNSNSDNFQFWKIPILTNSNSDNFQFWQIPNLTNSNSDKFQFWQIPILTNSDSNKFQFWQIPILTNSNLLQKVAKNGLWQIPILTNSVLPRFSSVNCQCLQFSATDIFKSSTLGYF